MKKKPRIYLEKTPDIQNVKKVKTKLEMYASGTST